MIVRSVNPANGQVIQEFKSSSEEEIHLAIHRARQTFDSVWSATTAQQRVELFNRLARIITEQTESLLDLILLEMGKPRGLGAFEVDDIVAGIGHLSSELLKQKRLEFPIDSDVYPQTTVELPLVPMGVVGIISPWNFPFWTPMTNIVPALLAGNTVVFKPDEHTTLMGLRIKELFDQAGFPSGVFSVIVGSEDVGKTLVASEVDKIVLTGSIAAGADVLRRAGIKPALLELGGNDPAIVCDDADLDQAVAAICWGAVYNAGQACNGIKRVFVHADVADEFIKRAVKYVSQLQRGRDYGPIIDEQARATIVQRVQDAAKGGAKLILGGDLPLAEGFWLDPILLVYNNDDLLLTCEETFGPVIPIRVVASNEEAIRLANQTGFGLGANVWTRDIDTGRRLAMQLQSKMVCVNEALFGLPGGEYWGGWRNSGLPTTENRLMSFLKRKLLVTHAGSTPRSWWFPEGFHW